MMETIKEILSSAEGLIGAITGLVTGLSLFAGAMIKLINTKRKNKQETKRLQEDHQKAHQQREQLEKENTKLKDEIKDLSAPMVMNLQSLNELQELAIEIFKETEASRFLILVATNGIKELRQCSVIYEQHMVKDGVSTSIGASGRYVNFEFDDTYRKMLKDIEYQGAQNYIVSQMPACALKAIYTREKVTASKVMFLRRTKIDDYNDRVWYCSIATHKPDGFAETDRIMIRARVGQIQHLLKGMT